MSALSALLSTQPRLAAVLGAAVVSKRMHHAYLLVGADEGAAQSLANAVAAALVCLDRRDADACGTCLACRKLAAGNHPDVITLAPSDKKTIAIDQVREAAGRIALRPSEASTKVVLVMAADSATPQAQNALLKTLEEPPGATCFLLTATRLRALLPTVRSRCAILRLASRDRLGAWQELAQGGIAVPLARALGPLVGGNVERATELVELGAEEVLATLAGALAPGASVSTVLAAAADLGQKRERADLALALLEVQVRDALAAHRGVSDGMLYGSGGTDALNAAPSFLARAAARLSLLRRLAALHLNRTLAVEAVFRDLGAGLADGA
jgi:DNA polymerase III subunit delta'